MYLNSIRCFHRMRVCVNGSRTLIVSVVVLHIPPQVQLRIIIINVYFQLACTRWYISNYGSACYINNAWTCALSAYYFSSANLLFRLTPTPSDSGSVWAVPCCVLMSCKAQALESSYVCRPLFCCCGRNTDEDEDGEIMTAMMEMAVAVIMTMIMPSP